MRDRIELLPAELQSKIWAEHLCHCFECTVHDDVAPGWTREQMDAALEHFLREQRRKDPEAFLKGLFARVELCASLLGAPYYDDIAKEHSARFWIRHWCGTRSLAHGPPDERMRRLGLEGLDLATTWADLSDALGANDPKCFAQGSSFACGPPSPPPLAPGGSIS